jgi:RNA polymerase sigma-70 factor (ECF subfamily)
MREDSELEKTVGEAFIALREPIYRYVLSSVRDPGDAEDIAQEAFVRLFRELRKGQRIVNVKAWMFRVAHNLVIDFSRRAPAPESLDAPNVQWLAEGVSDPGPSAEQTSVDQASRRQVLACLTDQERRCMELRAEGLRYREIGEVLGVKIPTVQTTLERAIRKISERSRG